MTSAVAIAFFFLVWGILHDGGDDAPWIPAGLGASIVLGSAVFIREVILRNARNRYIAQQRLDHNLRATIRRGADGRPPAKLTLEQNAAMLKELREKSKAAKVFGHLAPGHREVFEMAGQYLAINEHELKNVGVGSPRLAALIRGKEVAEGYHKFHMLNWAEIESKGLTLEARNSIKTKDKIETAQKALSVIDAARRYYPDEPALVESEAALKEFVSSIQIAYWIEQAERAAFKGNKRRAESLYKDALFYLDRADISDDDRRVAEDKINAEIKKLGTSTETEAKPEPKVVTKRGKKKEQ